MASKKKPTLSRAILSLLIGMPSLIALVAKIISLIGIEARLAGRSLMSIIILSLTFALLITTTWSCLLIMLFLYLVSLTWSAQQALLIILSLNILLLIIIALSIAKFKKKLLFPETRRRIKHARRVYEDL